MVSRIFELPEIPMTIVSGLIFAAMVAIGIVVINKLVHPKVHGDGSANGIIEMSLGVFSAFYGILIGLLAVGAYENINTVEAVVAKEASAISALYWDFDAYPEPARGRLEASLKAYVHEVRDRSFAQHARGVSPQGERHLIVDMSRAVIAFEPRTKGEEALQSQSLQQLTDLQDARQDRVSHFDVGIPGVLWWIVGLGAAINLLLICLLEFPLKLHIPFGCLLAFYIGAMIFVIASMDNPFTGSDHVGPKAIRELTENLRELA